MAENNSPSASSSSSEDLDYQLELPSWSLDQLRSAAIEQRVVRPRTLAWAIMLQALPPPNGDIVSSMKNHRQFYNDLKAKLSMDPRTVIGDDPLSQNDESAWKQHFCDNELKNLILQDVVRTFPDELYFREKDVQDLMVRVLFYWARAHKYVGYRQGMHEILAPMLFELYLDRNFAPNNISDKLQYILEEQYLEHDSYMMFSAVMKGLERFYTTGETVPSSCGRLPSSRTVHNPNEVVRYLDNVREEYLVALDSELAAHMLTANISMELFGIRWLRLLFGREFQRSEIPHLWGFLFADGPTLPNLHYVIVAILISMRSKLLDPEPGAVLSALMRPCAVSARHVIAHALHLRSPRLYPAPPAPPASPPPAVGDDHSPDEYSLELRGSGWWEGSSGGGSGSEGVAEGADVARSLAALAVLRARLPPAARALADALPKPNEKVRRPLMQILQLAALLQCRNHELIDVETALEADEGPPTDQVGRKQLVPVAITNRRTNKQTNKPPKIKEVPLTVFHQGECQSARGFPCLDPLRLRTE